MRPNLFILLYLAVPLLAQHTLLEFREISTIKLSVGHEKIQISINDIFSDMEMFMNDVESFNCTSDDCDKGKSLLIEALQLKNTTIRSIFSDQQNLRRKKRSWDPIGKGLKWMSGVMDSDDRASLNRKVNILYDNQKTIYNQLESLLSKPELLKAENAAEFVEVESELKHVQELIGLQSFNEKFTQISLMIDGIWRTYFNKKIDGIFVNSESLDKVKEMPRLACEKIIDCIMNADADVEMENSKFIIVLKIPTVTDKHLKLYEITSIPSDLDSHIIVLKLPTKYFGYDEENKKIIAVNANNLNLCRKTSDSSIMYCRAQDIIQNVNTDECLEKAFRDKEIDLEICGENMELWRSDVFGVVELGNGDFWVHTKSRKDMTLFCNKKDRDVRTFKHSQIFHLAFGCHAVFRADGIDLTSYAVNDESDRLKSISANISKSNFIDVVETMIVSNYMKNGFLVNIENFKPKGLTLQPVEVKEEKFFSQSQSINAEELKIIRAQHHEALIIVAVLAVSLMLFIALKSGKLYIMKFLPPPQPKEIDEEQDVNEMEEKNLNEKKM